MSLLLRAIAASKRRVLPSTPFFTSFGGTGTPRNNWPDYVGCRIIVGGSPITLTHLGRWVLAGSSLQRTVSIFDSSFNLLDSAVVNNAGAPVDFLYGAVTPRVLGAGQTFYIGAQETSGGDYWYDLAGLSLTNTGVASVLGSYRNQGPEWITVAPGSGDTFGPVNFKYRL